MKVKGGPFPLPLSFTPKGSFPLPLSFTPKARLPEAKRKAYIQKLAYLVKLRKDITLEYEALRKEVMPMPIVIDLEKDPAYKKERVLQGCNGDRSGKRG